MGLSSSTTKTKATTTPTNPQFTTDAVQAQTDAYKNFMARDPQSLVAGPSALQQSAFSQAGNLGGWQAGNQAASTMAQTAGNAGPSLYDGVNVGSADQAGRTEIGPLAQAQTFSAADNYDRYKNPALNDVVKASLAEYDANSGAQRAAMDAQAAGAGAFGGSRYGVQRGQFEADTGRGRALTDAQLRSNAFMQAMGLAGQDADRQQNSSQFNTGQTNSGIFNQAGLDQTRNLTNTNANNQFKLAQSGYDAQEGMFNAQAQESALARQLAAAGLTGQLASDYGNNARADLGLTADLGNIQQQIEQAKAYAPAQQLLVGSQALGATPYNLFTGQNMTGTSKQGMNVFQSILAGAQNAASAVAAGSDRRLKRDIEQVGQHGKLKLYSFNYHWDAADRKKRKGVMADEVAQHVPEALGPVIAGYATVNYEKLGLAHLVEGE